ncbi:MAG: beta-galactosidase [FCB group bacterium]|jgi:hypothetical protein|nr:beta-galactosidase [FCB group bacterium]
MTTTAKRFAWLFAAMTLVSLGATAAPPEGWLFSNGPEFPGAKGSLDTGADGVMHLRYDFTGGGNYVGAFQFLDPPQTLKSVEFRVKKPAEALMTLRVVDSTDQLLQEPIVFEHDEWQRVAVDMQAFDLHFGGANDGVVHFPIKAVGILFEAVSLANPTGEVLLSHVKFNISGGDGAPQSGELRGRFQVTDFGRGTANGITGGPWHVDFSKTGSASLHSSLSLLGNPRVLTVLLRGGKPGNVLKMTLGSHFQTFARTLGTLDGKDQAFTFSLPPGNGWEFSGGENDGEVRLPLRITSLTLERGAGPAEPTGVEIQGILCETSVPRDEATFGLASLRSASGKAIEAACTACNLLERDLNGTMTVTLLDWTRNEVAHVEFEQVLPANGKPVQISRGFEVPDGKNFAEARFDFKADKEEFSAGACWTRPLDGTGDTTLRPELPWGMGVYLYRYGDLNDMEKAAQLAQAAGVKWSREEFSWAATEPEQGKFDFHFYDAVVNTARSHGISVYGLLSYWSNWTEPYTEKGIDDFCVWAKAVVTHFKDRVKHWEVYNEPNIFFWQGPKDLYPVLLKKCYAAIKEADPEAQVLGCSTAGIDQKFIDMVLAAEAPFDILTVHPYRGFLSDGGFMKELRRVAERVEQRPVWITEMGWSTHVGGKDERSQASLLARCYLSAAASGACPNISWYDFRDDANDPFYNEANFGTLRHDFTPKPAYRALATVCRTLNTGTPRLRDDLGKDVFGMEMGNCTVVWSPLKSVKLPCAIEGDAQIINLMGEPVAPQGGSLTLLRGQPLFITGGKLTATGTPEPIEDPSEGESGVIQF